MNTIEISITLAVAADALEDGRGDVAAKMILDAGCRGAWADKNPTHVQSSTNFACPRCGRPGISARGMKNHQRGAECAARTERRLLEAHGLAIVSHASLIERIRAAGEIVIHGASRFERGFSGKRSKVSYSNWALPRVVEKYRLAPKKSKARTLGVEVSK